MSTGTRTEPPRWAPLSEASEYLRVSEKTLRRLISSGAITGYRMGPRLLRVDLNELDDHLRPIPTAGGGRVA